MLGIHGLPSDYDHDAQAQFMENESLEEDFYRGSSRGKSPQQLALDGVEKLNKDQLAAFNKIKKALLENNSNKLFFVEGAGGCGWFLL